MALGTGLYGTSGTHDKYVPEIWSKEIQAAFESNAIARQNCMDLSSLVSAMGGDVIHVPKLANRTAATRALSAFTEITPTAATEGEFTMNVQTWVTDDEFISDSLPVQTKLFMMSQVDAKMRESIGRKFDTDVWATYTDFTTTKGTDDGATLASPDNFFDALEQLDTNFCPKEDRVIIVSPKQRMALIKNNVLASSDYTSTKGMESGKVPTLDGVPVLMSQNLPTTAAGSKVCLVLHKSGIAFAIPKNINIVNEHYAARRGTIVGGDMLYGAKVYRPEAGIPVYGL